MSKAAQATLRVAVAVFSFDPDPATVPARAARVLTVGRGLPSGDVDPRERFEEAALRVVAETGLHLEGGRRRSGRLSLVAVDDEPSKSRTVTAWYYAAVPLTDAPAGGGWTPVSRIPRLEKSQASGLKAAMDRLRSDTRNVAAAAALLGDVFTGDDLLRFHTALHGGPQGSERTFRRRVQELRDSGVLKPVRDSEVRALRLQVARFRSPAGTGGRPPELLRYSGTGGEEEQLAALRARRSA